MVLQVRVATDADVPGMVPLLVADAEARAATDPVIWAVAQDAAARVERALRDALTGASPVRQRWLVAEDAGELQGVAHAILLPVPPIYAGRFGMPGLIMEDCALAPGAQAAVAETLLAAAEADIAGQGARIVLASTVPGAAFADAIAERGYVPLTRYLARTGLRAGTAHAGIRPAETGDVAEIVRLSARHRRVLHGLEPFWEPHADADARFGAWMGKSLGLGDRDMLVCTGQGGLDGYAVSQPATPLHFPPAHDIAATGVIDDFHHVALEDPDVGAVDDHAAHALLGAAEAARAARGGKAVMVVCPAAWRSKVALLEAAGYRTAITWHIRRVA